MAAAARLVLVNVPPADWSFPVTGARQLIGRCREAEIPVPPHFCTVSRRHAEVWRDRDGFWLCDLGSCGGTRVNGIWLKPDRPAMIVPGDRLTLGGAELRIEPSSQRAAKAANCRPATTQHMPGNPADSETVELPRDLPGRVMAEGLTYCEHNILLWMGRGYTSDDDLARLLHRSRNTVRTEVASILRKSKLRSRASVLNVLLREGSTARISRARRDASMP
jgi:DNA-binding CsgD family transcriptional regulator